MISQTLSLWTIGAVGIVTVAISACRTTEVVGDLKATQVVGYNGEGGMKPGVGYETVYEDTRGVCVDWDGVETAGGAQEVTYDFDLVENTYDLASTLNVSNASAVKAAVPNTPGASVSAKTKFAMGYSYTLNRYSVYIVAKAEVRNETTQLSNVRIKEDKKSILASPTPEAVDQYRLECGDSYMSGYTTGGEFFGVLEIQTETEEQNADVKREIQASLAAEAIGEISTESSFSATLKKITKNKNVHIWTYQRGGQGAEQVGLVDTVDGMLARIKSFPSYVASVQVGQTVPVPATIAGEGGGVTSAASNVTPHPANYTAMFKDYFTLSVPLPAAYRQALFNGQDIMAELAGIQAKLIDDRGNIDFILKHPSSFDSLTATKIRDLKSYVEGIQASMKLIATTATKCHRVLADCVVPQALLAIKSPDLPLRRTTAQNLTRDIVLIKTAIQQIDVGQLNDGPFNPPECFIEVRAVAAGGKYKRVVRTQTDYTAPRCGNLSRSIEVPQIVMKEAFKSLGITENEGFIQVLFQEDDPGTEEDPIAKISKRYKDLLTQSAIADVMSGNFVTADISFEVR